MQRPKREAQVQPARTDGCVIRTGPKPAAQTPADRKETGGVGTQENAVRGEVKGRDKNKDGETLRNACENEAGSRWRKEMREATALKAKAGNGGVEAPTGQENCGEARPELPSRKAGQ